jgi:hypothetical protein
MFESGIDPSEWEPIPADELAAVGPWDFADAAGEPIPVPAGFDDWVHESQAQPVGDHTLALLNATPYELLSDEGRSLTLSQLDAVSTYVEALKVRLLARMAGPRPESPCDDFSAHEVAVATRCSVYTAYDKIAFARDLGGRLAATLEAMHRGEISWAQARALSEATCHLDVAIAREIEARLLRYSRRQDLTLFKASLRRWVARLDPDFAIRAAQSRHECVATHTAHGDGTGELYLRGPLEITTENSMALTARAAKTKASLGGTAAQRKLAALRDWAEIDLAAPDTPKRHGRTPSVVVTIDLATLLGLRDGPAEIPGVGPVPASAARWLLADGAPLRRLVTDPTSGRLLDYGQRSYVVPPALAEFLVAENIRSASPHSAIDAGLADMEHNVPFQQGGATDALNVTPVDRRWHRAKTHGGWSYDKRSDGSVVWTSPSGLTCTVDPYDYRAGP